MEIQEYTRIIGQIDSLASNNEWCSVDKKLRLLNLLLLDDIKYMSPDFNIVLELLTVKITNEWPSYFHLQDERTASHAFLLQLASSIALYCSENQLLNIINTLVSLAIEKMNCVNLHIHLKFLDIFLSQIPNEKVSRKFGLDIATLFPKMSRFIESDDVIARKIVLNSILPHFFTVNDCLKLNEHNTWLSVLWKQAQRIHFQENDADGSLSLLCRYITYYFPSKNISLALDLRCSNEFFLLLQAGLVHSDTLARKRSIHLLKSVVEFTEPLPSQDLVASWYFPYSAQSHGAFLKAWATFFLIYDTLEENVIHIIEPVWGHLRELVLNGLPDIDFHYSWVLVLLQRSFANENVRIQKFFLESMLRLPLPCHSPLLLETNFIFGPFFKALDDSYFYHGTGSCTLTSPFGEQLVRFWTTFYSAISTNSMKTEFVKNYLKSLGQIRRNMPLVYLVAGLNSVADCPDPIVFPWSSDDFTLIHQLFVGLPSNSRSKLLIFYFTINCVTKFVNLQTCDFDSLVSILAMIPRYVFRNIPACHTTLSKFLARDFSRCMDFVSTLLRAYMIVEMEVHFREWKSNEYNEARAIARMLNLLSLTDPCVISRTLQSYVPLFHDYHENEVLRFIMLVAHLKKEGCVIESAFLEPYRASLVSNIHRILFKTHYVGLPEWKLVKYCLINLELLGLTHEEHQIFYNEFIFSSQSDLSNPITIYLSLICAYKLNIDVKTYNGLILSYTTCKPRGMTLDTFSWNLWSSQCISAKWKLILKNSTSNFEYFYECLDDLESSTGKSVLDLLDVILSFVQQKKASLPKNYFSRFMSISWSLLYEYSRSGHLLFPAILQKMASIVACQTILADELLYEHVIHFFDEVFRWSDQRLGILSMICLIFSKSLVDIYNREKMVYHKIMTLYAEVFTTICVYGPLRKEWKDEFILAELSNTSKTNLAEKLPLFRDSTARALIWSLLLLPNQDSDVMSLYIEKLIVVATEGEVSMTRNTYINSYEHRRRLRALQSLAILIEYVNASIFERMLNALYDCIQKEFVFSSRYFAEWMIIRLLVKFPDHVNGMFLDHLCKNYNIRSGIACSYLTVLRHIGPLLPRDVQFSFFQKCFQLLISWLMCHHFTIRIYASSTFWFIYNFCAKYDYLTSLVEDPLVERTMDFIKNNAEMNRLCQRLLNDFVFSHFDPFQDYTVDFIFRGLPFIGDVAEDEQISFLLFDKIREQVITGEFRIPLFRKDRILNYYESACHVDLNEKVDEENISQENNENDVSRKANISVTKKEEDSVVASNVQKKIIPWEMMLLQGDLELARKSHVKQKRQSLIVVASLIDRVPNLAGLARTSEIFNIERLCFDSLNVTDDINFKNISVTAEKWVPLEQVKVKEIASYLQSKKAEGYTLLGLEQTANSASLGKFVFPKKCVLLLGREKEGIPTDLIQMLDTCIEIPQFGILRSLNVHVSGAIFMWEYTRQHVTECENVKI